MKDPSERDSNNWPETRAIVEKGVRYASQRFPESEELRRTLESAAIIESQELNHLLDVVPPKYRGGTATIRFSPVRVAALRREHRFPEWVVSANVERLVLSTASQWPLDAEEAVMLAAHRERRSRVRSSGAGPTNSE